MRGIAYTLAPFLFIAMVAYFVTGGGMMFGVLGSPSRSPGCADQTTNRQPIQPSEPDRQGEISENPFVP